MLTFRDITLADRDLVMPMVQAFYQTDAVDHPVDQVILDRSFLAAADHAEPLLRGVLLFEGEEPVGYLYLTQCYSAEVGGRCVFIEEIFLLPPFRGMGLGHQIMAWIESQYPSARRFRLEVTEVNQRAAALYEKSGYQYLHYDQMVLDKIREAGKYHVPEAKSFAPVGNAEASEPKINLENRVTDMIHDQKIVRKRHFAIKSVLLVAALVAMSSILAIAHNYGAALIDDSNRHLVGKGLHGEGQIIGADEEIEVPDEPSDGIWETTARIKSYKNVSISPNSITEFAVSGDA